MIINMVKNIKLILRFLLLPVILILLFLNFIIYYCKCSWYYFEFDDYWKDSMYLVDKLLLKLKLKNNI